MFGPSWPAGGFLLHILTFFDVVWLPSDAAGRAIYCIHGSSFIIHHSVYNIAFVCDYSSTSLRFVTKIDVTSALRFGALIKPGTRSVGVVFICSVAE